jgi:hypothetical protein
MTDRILFSQNHFALRQLDAEIARTQPLMQAVIDAFNAVSAEYLAKPAPATLEALKPLYTNAGPNPAAVNAYFRNLKAEALKSKYQEFGIEKIREFLEAPPTAPLIEAMQATHPGAIWNAFEVKGSKVVQVPDRIEAMKDQHRDYTDSPEAVKRLETVTALLACLQEIRESAPHIRPEALEIRGLVYADADGNLQPDRQYVNFNRLDAFRIGEIV